MSGIKLSTIRPDQADIRAQLQSALSVQDSWKDLVTTGTGQILLNFIAGGVAYNQYTIERAIQELFFETAGSAQSVYALTRLLGGRISRKSPATVTVTLNRAGDASAAYSVPRHSQFTVNGVKFFNNNIVNFAAGQASVTSVVLEEGTSVVVNAVAADADYQTVYVGTDFNVTDLNVVVTVDGVEWACATDGVWSFGPEDRSCTNLTTQLGELEVTFGNGISGAKPLAGSAIVIQTWTVAGTASNNANVGLPVAMDSNSAVTGTTTSSVAGAASEKSLDYYRSFGANLARADNRAVTRSDYRALLASYPDVVAASVVAEKEINPSDLRWMSTVGVVVLTGTVWTTAQKEALLTWLEERAIQGLHHQFIDAQAVTVNVSANLVIDSSYTASSVIAAAQTAIAALYAPNSTSLGKALYYSDIIKLLTNLAGVKHMSLASPSSNTALLYYQYIKLGTVTITASYA